MKIDTFYSVNIIWSTIGGVHRHLFTSIEKAQELIDSLTFDHPKCTRAAKYLADSPVMEVLKADDAVFEFDQTSDYDGGSNNSTDYILFKQVIDEASKVFSKTIPNFDKFILDLEKGKSVEVKENYTEPYPHYGQYKLTRFGSVYDLWVAQEIKAREEANVVLDIAVNNSTELSLS